VLGERGERVVVVLAVLAGDGYVARTAQNCVAPRPVRRTAAQCLSEVDHPCVTE